MGGGGGGEDKQVWLRHKSGSYTTKTAIEKQQNNSDQNPIVAQDLLKEVWKLTTSPELKLFIWKIKHRALPVGDRLEARQVLSGTKCIHCEGHKTISHLFFQCPYALKVWELVPFSRGFTQCLWTLSIWNGNGYSLQLFSLLWVLETGL